MKNGRPLSQWITDRVRGFVAQSPLNTLSRWPQIRIYADALVAFVRGDEPLFTRYKEVIGEFHLTPEELFSREMGEAVPGAELTVVSYIMPFSRKIRESNARQHDIPSALWAHSRHEGEAFNDNVRAHLVAELSAAGYQAVAAILTESFRWREDPRVGVCSTWSERHVAYAAGLGSFGLSDGFINPLGKAMRCGSVVVRAQCAPETIHRPDVYGHCPHFTDGSCGVCIKRCPAGAITSEGHDKDLCRAYAGSIGDRVRREHETVGVYGCGLCQVAVPCSLGIPPA